MKQFYLTFLLFALMLVGIAFNLVYIKSTAKDLRAEVSVLDFNDPNLLSKCESIQNAWEKKVGTVGLSVSYLVVDRISEQAATMVACAECHDLFGFQTAKALFLDAVGDMERLEQLSIENIL